MSTTPIIGSTPQLDDQHRPRTHPDHSRRTMMLLIFIYAGCAVAVLANWTTRDINTILGDEPNYLVMADALIEQHTFEVTEAYQKEYASHAIYPPGLGEPGDIPNLENALVLEGPHGRYSVHNIGLPILLAVPYYLGGTLGAKLFMLVSSVTIIVLAWAISARFTRSTKVRFWSVLPVSAGLPFLIAAGQIFPDLPAGLLSLFGLYWYLTSDIRRSPVRLFAMSVALCWLPWLQIKFVPTLVILTVCISLRMWHSHQQRASSFILPATAALAIGLLGAYNVYAFGRLAGPYAGDALALNPTSVMTLTGLLIDQNQGMLFANPLFFVGVFSIGRLFRFDRRFASLTVVVFLSLLVPNALHTNWYGGSSFSGRFMWSAATVFLIPTIYGLTLIGQRSVRLVRGVAAGAIIFQLYFAFRYAVNGVQLLQRLRVDWVDNYSTYFGRFNRLFPKLYNADWTYRSAVNYVWLVIVVTIFAAGFVVSAGSRRQRNVTVGSLVLIGFVGVLAASRFEPYEVEYRGKELQSLVGETVNDARQVKAAVDPPGVFTYTWGIGMRAGTYKATLTYSSPADPATVVGTFDVFVPDDKRTVAVAPLPGTGGLPMSVELSFAVNDGDPPYQYLSTWTGAADITVESMKIE